MDRLALRVAFEDRRVPFAHVRQLLALGPGRYTLSGRARPDNLRTDRGLVWTAETPQVFRTAIVLKAYRKVAELQRKVTDDSSAVEFVGQDVSLVENPSVNLKLTRPADFVLAEAILKTR